MIMEYCWNSFRWSSLPHSKIFALHDDSITVNWKWSFTFFIQINVTFYQTFNFRVVIRHHNRECKFSGNQTTYPFLELIHEFYEPNPLPSSKMLTFLNMEELLIIQFPNTMLAGHATIWWANISKNLDQWDQNQLLLSEFWKKRTHATLQHFECYLYIVMKL